MKRSASALIKEQTQPLHDHLDSQTMLYRLVDESLDPEMYAEILERMYLAWSACEQAARPTFVDHEAKKLWLDAELHLGSERLLDDLEHLSPGRASSIAERKAEVLPLELQTKEQCAGLCYVLAGSRLGAKFILRSLDQKSPRIRGSTCFFRSSAQGTVLSWKNFCNRLDSMLASEEQIMMAAETAAATFRLWIDLMATSGGRRH